MNPGLLFPLWVSRTPQFSLPLLLSRTEMFHCLFLSSPVSAAGMSIILGVAEGEVFVHDAEIQKSALQVSRSI